MAALEDYIPAELESSLELEAAPSFAELVDSFLHVPLRETSAVLSVVAAVTDDELLATRIRRELIARRHKLPGWLRQLDFTITGVEHVTEPFAEMDNLVVGVRLGSGYEFTIITMISHGNESAVKDSFVTEHRFADMQLTMRGTAEADQLTFTTMDRADARAKLAESIDAGLRLESPFETDSWPGLRPLLCWVIAAMPEGGSPWHRKVWSDEERAQLVDDFLASAHARRWEASEVRELVAELVRIGADWGPGDPLRWSPLGVEVVLMELAVREMVASADQLEQLPSVLSAFISFAHERSGMAEHNTDDSLMFLADLEDEYRLMIRGTTEEASDFRLIDAFAMMTAPLAEGVGGYDVLNALEVVPLPDEEFDTAGIPGDVLAVVGDVRERLDHAAEQTYGAQFRTACRRLLRDIAVNEPKIFRRKAAPERTAAAIAWMVARANQLIGYEAKGSVRDLLSQFGVSGSVSQRAEVLYNAVNAPERHTYWSTGFGHTRYLTDQGRAELIEIRDSFQARGEMLTPPVPSRAALTGHEARLRLTVVLKGSQPKIWRQLDVDAGLTLATLHNVLQAAFGWENEHLHAFSNTDSYGRKGTTMRWAAPSPWTLPGHDDGAGDLDESEWTIARAVQAGGKQLFYEYDFGDSWTHEITVEPVDADPAQARVVLTGGARRGPLEDSGGLGGYYELIDAIADPGHDRHEDLVEWLDGVWGINASEFDPEEFDLPTLNDQLQRLWP